MRNLSKLVFQRVVAVSVGILLQIGFLIVMATYLRADFFWIRIAMNVLSWAMVIYIISCGVNPSYKIAWIVLILAFPVAGLTIYLLFGGNKISSYEHRKMQSIEAVTMQQLQQEEEPLWELAAARTPAFNHARYLLSASGYPIYDDADATYFPSGESCYAAMLEELQKAEHYIFIEFFIIAQGKMWDPILQLLRERPRRASTCAWSTMISAASRACPCSTRKSCGRWASARTPSTPTCPSYPPGSITVTTASS